MTSEIVTDTSGHQPIGEGWFRWLTWFFVIVIGAGLVASLLLLAIGPDAFEAGFGIRVARPEVSFWWTINQAATLFFWIACVGVLLGFREAVSVAIVLAWALVSLQLLDAGAQLIRLHLSVPVGAAFYLAFALKARSVLRGQKRGSNSPPGSRGML